MVIVTPETPLIHRGTGTVSAGAVNLEEIQSALDDVYRLQDEKASRRKIVAAQNRLLHMVNWYLPAMLLEIDAARERIAALEKRNERQNLELAHE